MTKAEILDCLTDRPCDVCRFHESGKCERWNCVFEEKPDDAEDCADKRMTREEAIKALQYERKTALHENKRAFDMAIKALSAEPQKMSFNGLTNGEVIDLLFPGADIYHNRDFTLREMIFPDEWWDAPYKAESESSE